MVPCTSSKGSHMLTRSKSFINTSPNVSQLYCLIWNGLEVQETHNGHALWTPKDLWELFHWLNESQGNSICSFCITNVFIVNYLQQNLSKRCPFINLISRSCPSCFCVASTECFEVWKVLLGTPSISFKQITSWHILRGDLI